MLVWNTKNTNQILCIVIKKLEKYTGYCNSKGECYNFNWIIIVINELRATNDAQLLCLTDNENICQEVLLMKDWKQWDGFEGRQWKEEINVRDFIQKNYTPYDGDESFLEGATEATDKLWGILQGLQKEERAKGGVLDMDTDIVSGITSHGAGYLGEDTKELEQVVGLQTDKPLKRAFMPYGGIKMAEQACQTNGYEPDPELHKIFTEYCRTHNQGVFDAYTPEMKKARHNKIITGLP